MFSLVTALVSPHAIEALRNKRETLVSTLTENANVLCFQPNDSICLLQGEWESVKKAYAILEEFYFRAQAEIMVREMLKGNASQHMPKREIGTELADWSNSLLSSLLPLVGEQSEVVPLSQHARGPGLEKPKLRSNVDVLSAQDKRSMQLEANVKDCSFREDGCSGKNPDAGHVDTTTFGDGIMSSQNDDHVHDDYEDDEDPPILSKEGPCNADVISLSSEISDPKEMDLYDASRLVMDCHVATVTADNGQMLSNLPGSLEHAERNESDQRSRSPHSSKAAENRCQREPPQLSDNRCFESFGNRLAERKSATHANNATPPFVSRNPQSSTGTSSMAIGQPVAGSNSTFRTQQYVNDKLSTGCKLPQFSSLLFGGTTLPQSIPAWQYADLYSMHLSALQSMHVKQEPAPLISSSDLVPAPNVAEDDFKNHLGYRFDDDAPLQEMRCTHCSKTYRSEARMKEHIRTHEKDYVPVLHSCPKCSKSFTYRHNMVVHLRRFHYGWQPAKRHVCRICGIRFQKPYLLRLHEHKAHVLPM